MILDKYFLDQTRHRHFRPVHSKFSGRRSLLYSKCTTEAHMLAVRVDLCLRADRQPPMHEWP